MTSATKGSQPISDFFLTRVGLGGTTFLIFSDKGGGGVQYILTYMTKSKDFYCIF